MSQESVQNDATAHLERPSKWRRIATKCDIDIPLVLLTLKYVIA
jgi:hypothetical protein